MDSKLHVMLFPLMAPGHVIPMVDMAKLFASRGVKSTIVTTAGNVDQIRPSIDTAKGDEIEIVTLRFDPLIAGLADGAENLASLLTQEDRMRFMVSLRALSDPFEVLMRELAPDAIVSDTYLPWSGDVAADLGVPRLMFHGSGFFPMCVLHWFVHFSKFSLSLLLLLEDTIADVSDSKSDTIVLPGLPHRIEISKNQIQDPTSLIPQFRALIKQVEKSTHNAYGTVTNSFYELEPDYADLYRDHNGKNSWHIGPLSLCNRNQSDMSTRGGEASITNTKCLNWLSSKKPKSVVYVCFGSLCNFRTRQLKEIGSGLLSSGHQFLWVVRNFHDDDLDLGIDGIDEWTGLAIRGWAPQLSILNHDAIGAFVMHCGWNSCLEGIAAGVPMVTWPLYNEQFYNEKLLVEVLKVGVPVGSKNFPNEEENRVVLRREEIRKAIEAVMDGGDEAEERRKRVRELRRLAETAVDIGGSSCNHVDDLLMDLKGLKTRKSLSPLHQKPI